MSGQNPNIPNVGSDTMELKEILRELHKLRDTTTRYDMSFDSAL